MYIKCIIINYNRNFHLNKIFPLYLQKFLYYVLKSSDVLDILVPILFHLNDSRADQCKLCSQKLLTNAHDFDSN